MVQIQSGLFKRASISRAGHAMGPCCRESVAELRGGSISRGPAVPYWPAFPYYIFSCLHPLNAFLSSDAEQMKTYNNAADSMTYIFGGEGVTQYLLRGILERLQGSNTGMGDDVTMLIEKKQSNSMPEVRFVTAATAGGSVKFWPAIC